MSGRNRARAIPWSEEISIEICRRIAEDGRSLESISLDADMPSKKSVFNYLAKEPLFAQRYSAAMEARADRLFEEVIALADECPHDKEAAAAYRLRIDARKWACGRLNAKKYKEHVAIDHSGSVTIGLLDVLKASKGESCA